MTQDMNQTADKTPAEAPETASGARLYRPHTDIVETADGVMVMVEMPGVGAEDADITLDKRVLTIRGKVAAAAPDTFQPAYAEYGEGDYERAFTLSEDFDPDRIEAAAENGVLTLTLPRATEAKPRKITVKNI